MDPELIVADEPVSMLDVSIRTELLRLMLDLRAERGLTYLFITHDLSLAWVIADRIAVMYLGKIMEIGPAEQVIRSPHNPYTAALVSVSPSPDPPTAGRRGAQRTILVGETPDAAHVPTGCRFHPRCPLAFDRCRVEEPPLFDLGGGQAAACWLAEGGRALPVAAGRGRRRSGESWPRPRRRRDPYTTSADARPPARIADLLAVRGDPSSAEIRGARRRTAAWRPEPGEWCANECVGHLIEAERRGFAGRIRQILAADQPDIRRRSRMGPAAPLPGRRRPRPAESSPPSSRACAQRASASCGRRVPSQTSRGSGPHPYVGDLAWRQLGEWPHHDRNHIRQALARHPGPGLGPARQRPPVRRRRIGGRVGVRPRPRLPRPGTFSGVFVQPSGSPIR